MSTITNKAPQEIMYEILGIMEEIDLVLLSLTDNNEKMFGDLSLRRPKFLPPELGFILTVSWFYVHFFEEAKVNIDFLMDKFNAFNIDPQKNFKSYMSIVHHLRTVLQHNLNPVTATKKSEQRNSEMQRKCGEWKKKYCGTPIPHTDEDWAKCLIGFLNETQAFLFGLKDCIRNIERDESSASILEEWGLRRSRNHRPYQFEEIISIVAHDIGKDSIDPQRICKKYYQDWKKYFEDLKPNYDFQVEARKLIEYVLLTEQPEIIPITGEDILQEFGIKPGREVGELLKKARELYKESPCSSRELLDRLKK